MDKDKDSILGIWKEYPLENESSGIVSFSEKSIDAEFFNLQRNSFNNRNLQIVSTSNSSEGEVTLFNLFNKRRVDKGNYEESWYDPEYVLVGKSLKNDLKIFDSLSFSLESLHNLFSPGIQAKRVFFKNQRNITLKQKTASLTQKSKQFGISIKSSFAESIQRNYGNQYKPYTRITLSFNQKISTRKAVQYIKEMEEFFTFLTRQHCYPKDIYLYEGRSLPNELIIKEYLAPNNLSTFITPLFGLNNKSYTFKKVLQTWPAIYKKKRLYFNLFSSEKQIKGQYLDSIFFDLITIVDHELSNQFGSKLEYKKYKNIKHNTIQTKLQEDKARKKFKPSQFILSEASFRDMLLKFLEEDGSSLLSKIRPLAPGPTQKLSGINFNFQIADDIKNLRDDIAHGEQRRKGKYLYEYSLITRFIALHFLLKDLGLSKKKIDLAIQNLPYNYY